MNKPITCPANTARMPKWNIGLAMRNSRDS